MKRIPHVLAVSLFALLSAGGLLQGDPDRNDPEDQARECILSVSLSLADVMAGESNEAAWSQDYLFPIGPQVKYRLVHEALARRLAEENGQSSFRAPRLRAKRRTLRLSWHFMFSESAPWSDWWSDWNSDFHRQSEYDGDQHTLDENGYPQDPDSVGDMDLK